MKTKSNIKVASTFTNNIRRNCASGMRSMMKSLTAACLAVVCLTASKTQAGDVQTTDRFYLKMDGITGGAQAGGHKGEIEVISYSLGVSNTGSRSSAVGGPGVGRVNVQDVHITKGQDTASPILFLFCASGRHIPKVILKSVTTVDGTTRELEYSTVTLEDVTISSYQAGDSLNNPTGASEQVSLAYGKLTITVTSFDANGKVTGKVTSGYDVRANRAF